MSVNSSSYPKMIFSCSISSGVKSFVCLSGCVQRQMSSNVYMLSQSPSTSCCLHVYSSRSQPRYIDMSISSTPSISSVIGSPDFRGNCFSSRIPKQRQLSCVRSLIGCRAPKKKCTLLCQSRNMSVLVSKQGLLSKIRSNMGSMSWSRGFTSAGLLIGLLISYSTCKTTNAEAAGPKEDKADDANFSGGKRIFMDYSVIGIPGDGRCLFRSIVHGVSLRAGKAAPSENLQRELADDLRSRVADEFVKRREETEWFIEGDFDSYVLQMRRPHVWGGEPELLMASHVLQMPITVYMHDENSGGLISIAEYGQEYGKENPIRVLYHGFGHYDALQVLGKGTKARM